MPQPSPAQSLLSAGSPGPGARPRRQRLRPDARIPQILEAALHEFSLRGFAATRIDDIAARAGISKGGVYAHFDSKAEVLEAVLQRWLPPPQVSVEAVLDGAANAREACERLIDALYRPLDEPHAVSATRLLLAEGDRLPALVSRGRSETVGKVLQQLDAVLQAGVARGLFRPGTVVRHAWLVLAPLVHGVIMRLALIPAMEVSAEAARAAHTDLLCELLAPVPDESWR